MAVPALPAREPRELRPHEVIFLEDRNQLATGIRIDGVLNPIMISDAQTPIVRVEQGGIKTVVVGILCDVVRFETVEGES